MFNVVQRLFLCIASVRASVSLLDWTNKRTNKAVTWSVALLQREKVKARYTSIRGKARSNEACIISCALLTCSSHCQSINPERKIAEAMPEISQVQYSTVSGYNFSLSKADRTRPHSLYFVTADLLNLTNKPCANFSSSKVAVTATAHRIRCNSCRVRW
jgi:hypothetical protein